MIQTHSINTSNEHTLINFNIPNYLKKNFDSLVKFKRVSRTSILNQLIDRYVRFELDQIEKDNKINSLLNDIEKRNQKDLKKEIPSKGSFKGSSISEIWDVSRIIDHDQKIGL